MSIKVYFTQISSLWDDAKLRSELARLPAALNEKISAYKDPADRQARICGKLLLQRLITDLGLPCELDDMQYTAFNKPFFEPPNPLKGTSTAGQFDFSIAHAGGMVVCAGAVGNKIGVDIEQLREINLNDFREQLTDKEWNFIHKQGNRSRAFLLIWTRKEALMKATGRGVHIDMNEVDVIEERVSVDEVAYSFHPVNISNEHVGWLAMSAMDEVDILEI